MYGPAMYFSADIWQQKRFATLQHGYSCMEQRQYDEAIVDFEEYLDIDSVIYWYLIEHIMIRVILGRT